MMAVGNLLSDMGHSLAVGLAKRWGHQEGSVFRRISPSLFTTRDPSDWNNFQARFSAEQKALGIHCQYFLFLLLLGPDLLT